MNQQKVRLFIQQNGLESPPAYRLLDLTAEVGELAADATASTQHGKEPEEISIDTDEIGDALFALLALADALNVDADAALDEAIEKYEQRMHTSDAPSSGEGD